MLTVAQAAEALGVGKDTVYGLIKHEGLPAVSVGLTGKRLKLRVYVASLDQWIKEREQTNAPGMRSPTHEQMDVQRPERKRRASKSTPSSGRDVLHPTPGQRRALSS